MDTRTDDESEVIVITDQDHPFRIPTSDSVQPSPVCGPTVLPEIPVHGDFRK